MKITAKEAKRLVETADVSRAEDELNFICEQIRRAALRKENTLEIGGSLPVVPNNLEWLKLNGFEVMPAKNKIDNGILISWENASI